MKNAANLNDRFYQELIDRIKNGQEYNSMLENYDPHAIRDILEEAAGRYAKSKGITHPFDLFENPELLKKIQLIENPNLADHASFKYKVDPKTGLYLPDEKASIIVKNKGDLGTSIHETQHAYDEVSRPKLFLPDEPSEQQLIAKVKDELDLPRKIRSMEDLKGMEEAVSYSAGHFKPDVEGKFEKLKSALNLERVVKGEPLKTIAPILKGAGYLGTGLAAASIANKAMAGEPVEAAKEAADFGSYFIPYVGEARMAKDIGEGLFNAPKYLYDKITETPSVFEKEMEASDSKTGDLPESIMKERERFNKLKTKLKP